MNFAFQLDIDGLINNANCLEMNTEKQKDYTVKVSIIDSSYLSIFVINHDVVRLHVTMHDTLTVAELQCLQNETFLLNSRHLIDGCSLEHMK